MHCPSCNAANADSNRFCESCGTGFTQACASCGHTCAPAARFCGECGATLSRRANPSMAVPAPPHADTWGELKQATVLFADIVGSTEQIAGLDPEQAMERLRPAVFSMCEAVERFGGTVIRTLGDGVMALFGVPVALEGHSVLACEAALAMQASFKQAPGGLMIRVGLHSGQVASDPQDAIGSRGGGAHGLTIHLASRVIALAEPGGICLTGATKALLGQVSVVRAMGDHALKGIAGLTPIFALQGLLPKLSGTHAAIDQVTPFRGRLGELGVLQDAVLRVQQGDGLVIGVCAEPGGGKSRLCQEFVRACRGQGLRVYQVGAQLYGHATPLQPILELLRGCYFGIAPSDSADIARTRITHRLLSLALPPHDIDLVCDFLGVADPQALPSGLNPRGKHQAMLGVLRKLVHDDEGQCTIILFEDLHWLDDASEEYVAVLVEAVAGTKTLLVLNYRPHYQPRWAQAAHFTALALPDLTPGDMEVLVTGLLGSRPVLGDVCRLIVARSAGNPFFAEELVRTLVDSEWLSGIEQGLPAGRLAQIELALPATVQAVISAKVDQLGEPEKTLLQMCAIIGKEIPMAVIAQVASPLNTVLERGLAGLRQAGLIVQPAGAASHHFAFRHPLIQEVTYGMQLKVRRVVLHAAVAQAMEAYYRDQLNEFAALIAFHHEAADQFLSAADYTGRAAQWIGATDSGQSVKYWRKVRGLLAHVPADPMANRLRVMAGGQMVVLGWREGLAIAELRPIIDECVALADEVDDRMVQLLLVAQGRVLAGSGASADHYVSGAQNALSLVAPGDAGRTATIQAFLCQAYGWAGRLREALTANDQAFANLHRIDPFDRDFIGFDLEQWMNGIRVRLLIKLGRFDEATTLLGRALKDAQAWPDPVLRQIAQIALVELASYASSHALPPGYAHDVVALAQRHPAPYIQVFSHYCRARVAMHEQDLPEALAQLDAAVELVRVTPVALEFEAELLGLRALCLVRTNQAQAGLDQAREAAALALHRGHRFAQCQALLAQGLALSYLDNPRLHREAATALLDQSEGLIAETGAECLRPLLDTGRARWHEAHEAAQGSGLA